MKKIVFLLIIIIGSGLQFADPKLVDFYRKGKITLEADPHFGKSTDWESLFYNERKNIVRAKDGSFFVCNSREHHIFKFDSNGKFLLKFGKRGRGPGDLHHPNDISILDDKYLVVGEYALTRRISLFDLDGKFVKIVKTGHSVFDPRALKNNKIAYMYYSQDPKQKKNSIRKTIVVVIDAETGKEKTIDTIETIEKTDRSTGTGITLMGAQGLVITERTKNGNLLVGKSSEPDIKIYSPEGKQILTFKLNMSPIPTTKEYINKKREQTINQLKEASGQNKLPPALLKSINTISWDNYYGKFLNFYYKITVDSNGNILVFKQTGCVDNCTRILQVYSPAGEYICESAIDTGPFKVNLSHNNQTILFTDHGIFGLFSLKDCEDISLRIVKVGVQ